MGAAVKEIFHAAEYIPRQHQRLVHGKLKRFSSLVCHRAFGKTVLAVNALIGAALKCQDPRAEFLYIAPLRYQAKGVAWSALLHYSAPYRDAEPNIAELWVQLRTGQKIRLFGADNPDAMRGIHPHGVVFDEFGDMDPTAWTQVIRPALSTHKGFALFIGTPKGRNTFHDVHQAAMIDPEWYAGMFKASETGIIPESELAANRKAMTEEEYAQEFECSFQAPNIGAYYGKEMAAADADKRITRAPWEPSIAVTTAWDLGMSDSTAIWFCQQIGKEIRLIDYYENSGEGLAHYAGVLKAKRYVYADHLLPHDTAVRELGTGVSRVETLQSLGITPTVVPIQRVEDGINAVRMLLPKCWFDAEKCTQGLKALQNYQREWAPKLGTWRSAPKHDWASHGANAFMYLALGLKPITSNAPIKYPPMAIA